jgi:hypothetical protein
MLFDFCILLLSNTFKLYSLFSGCVVKLLFKFFEFPVYCFNPTTVFFKMHFSSVTRISSTPSLVAMVLLFSIVFVDSCLVLHGVFNVEDVINVLFLHGCLGIEDVSNWSCY